MKTRILLIGAAVLGWAVCAQATTITYNAADDFSISNGNPNGAWSYGHYTTDLTPSTFALLPTGGTITGATAAGIEYWHPASGSDPGIAYNPTASTITGWSITWAPGALSASPGANGVGDGTPAVVRWTAPEAGTVDISAIFSDIQQGRKSDVYAYLDSVQKFSGSTQPSAATWTTDDLTVAAGDTIDFVVHSANSGTSAGTTGLEVTVALTPVPEPSTLALLTAGALGLLCYAWRKRK